jgi:hypothetical protein
MPAKVWVLLRRHKTRVVIALVVLIICSCLYWRFRTIGTCVAWMRMGQYDAREIVLRTLSPESDVLLIGLVARSSVTSMSFGRGDPAPAGPVYRFNPGSRRLEPSSYEEWERATGAITFRFMDRDFSIDPFKRRSEAGTHVLDSDVSPDRRFVSVVSGNGTKSKGSFGWFPWGLPGGAYPLGPYYHETFDRLTGAKVGQTYTLDCPAERVNLSYCWEAQGKFVVYHDTRGRYLWVVPGPANP